MDPLSLIANVVAVLSAARGAIKSLKRLKDAGLNSTHILELIDEATDFEKVVATVERTIIVIGHEQIDPVLHNHQPTDPIFNQYLGSLIQRAKDEMARIGQLAEEGWIRDSEQVDQTLVKGVWKSWLKKNDILKISKTVHILRQDLAAALTVLTASQVPHVRTVLREIVLRNDETRTALVNTTSTVNDKMNSMSTQLSAISPRLNALANHLSLLSIQPNNIERHPAIFSGHSDLMSISKDIFGTRIGTTGDPSSLCHILCSCNCHKPSKFNSPKWASNIVGVVLLSWSGVLGRPICNEKQCQRSQTRMLKVTYYLPQWFIQRVMFLQYQFTTLENHRVFIKISQRIPNESRVLFAAENFEVDVLRSLFSAGLASPFDITEYGMNLLMFVVTSTALPQTRHVETCRFLLQQSCNPRQEDDSSTSMLHRVCDLNLIAPQNPHVQALKAMLEQYSDLDFIEDMEPFGFTIIHKIVLGLSHIDLSSQLQLSTANIDTGCSRGRTPLMWAVKAKNEVAVRKLLQFGARVDILAQGGYSAIHYTSQNAESEILEMLISAAHSQETSRALELATRCYGGQILEKSAGYHNTANLAVKSLLDSPTSQGDAFLYICCYHGLYDKVKILISHGASMESQIKCFVIGKFPRNPLSIAVQNNWPRIIQLLVDSGANTRVKDEENMTILHLAGEWGNMKTIRLLTGLKLCCLSISEKDVYGRTPLEAFDMGRPQRHAPETPETRQRCREAFLELLASVKLAGSEHICTVRDPAASDAEGQETIGEVEVEPVQEDGSDDGSFFEARSTFEDSDVSLDDASEQVLEEVVEEGSEIIAHDVMQDLSRTT